MSDTRPSTIAHEVAVAVTAAWQRTSCNPSTLEIPLGTVAALTLHGRTRHGPGCGLAALDGAELLAALRETWARTWLVHPYPVQIASPIHGWLDADPAEETVRAVVAVTRAAYTAGLERLTDPHHGGAAVDLLGFLATELRPARARQHLGEFYTPPEVADVMAAFTLPDLPQRGRLFTDPTAGTGGLLAATANRIRQLGGDPGDYGWELADINYLSVACAAANTVIWGLGDHVLVYRADTLAPGDHRGDAVRRRAQVLEHHREVLRAARLAAILTGAISAPKPSAVPA